MALTQGFELTPRKSLLYTATGHRANMICYGISFFPNHSPDYRYSYEHQHESDEFYFHGSRAGDPAANYALHSERQYAPHIHLIYDLSDFTPHKEVALIFRFDAVSESRILVYTNAGLLGEETLHVGDDQFLIEVESTNQLYLYFIHAVSDGSPSGGTWFFRGIDGYIA